MSTFHSGFAGHIEDFIRYRKASGIWNTTYEKNLLLFDRYCSNTFPPGDPLCQDMIDKWCAKRETELNRACDTRICVIPLSLTFLP